MEFRKLLDCIDRPRTVYDGVEVSALSIPIPGEGAETRELTVDLSAPEARAWRHYYTDRELNRLKDELRFGFRFVMSREAAYSPALGESIYLQPSHRYGAEYTVCFSYKEQSAGRYVFWLIAVLRREVERAEFDRRVADINRYWLPPGG
jgi:hypothetical protein